ncbi:MAG TPA: tetratricopeptide repeat protein, partial [Acidimicrobiia bacterium]|nr:tetratricopeptide repeat protein [Acidimicrobiia bacterium]
TDDPEQIDLLIALGEAQRRAGHPAHRETLLDAAGRARQRNDADALARAALANCRGSMTSNAGRLDPERNEALEAALELAGDADSPTRARLMAHHALEQSWTGDLTEIKRLTGEATAMARRLGDPATLADVLLTSFYPLYAPSTIQQRLDHTDELLTLTEELGDRRIALHAYHHRIRAAMELGDLAEAERCIERQRSLAAEIGEPTMLWMAAINGVGVPLAAGELAVVEESSIAGLAMAQDAQPDAQTIYAAQMLVVRYEQGRLEEVLPMFVELAADPDFKVPAAEAITAFIYCELDRPDEARPHYEAVAADRFAGIRFDHLWLMSLAVSAEAAVRLGDSESALVLSDLMAPYSDLIVTLHSWNWNCVTHYLGLLATGLGRYEEADAHFQATVERQLRLGTPAWLAHTRLEWARMLLARRAPGDEEQARGLLSQALAAARDLGLANVERRTVALMQ